MEQEDNPIIVAMSGAIERRVGELTSGDYSLDYVTGRGKVASMEVARAAYKAMLPELIELVSLSVDMAWQDVAEPDAIKALLKYALSQPN